MFDTYYMEYGIIDHRLSPKLTMKIHSVREKSIPVIGPVVDVHWKGKDYGRGIINRLNSDEQIQEPIKNSHDVKIVSIGNCGCWVMVTKTGEAPSQELWDCYQRIAEHLLAEWPSK